MRSTGSAFLLGLVAGIPFVLSGCAETPVRAPAASPPVETVAPPSPPKPPTAPPPAAEPPPDVVTPPATEPRAPSGPPPDLAFSMAADDAGPPAAVDRALGALVARLKKSSALSMRLTLFAPPVASREYALGLAAKASETLRRHLRGLGVPTRKIIRVVIDPRRGTVSASERIDVEVRLIGGK